MSKKERSLRVEGVVIKHQDWGEADRLLIIFTREIGKIRTIAKGVRKPRSRKAGHLEPFTRASLLLAKGRDFYILTQAEAIDTYDSIKDNLVNLSYASYVVELLTSFTYEGEENRDLYRLVTNTLSRLNQGDSPEILIHYYEIRLLDYAGFRPQLFECTRCHNEILPENQFFSAVQGGIFCPKCGRNDPQSHPISTGALKYLRHFQRSSYKDASRAKIKPEVSIEIERIMYYYLTHVLEKDLKTPSFLKRMKYESSQSKKV
jgi:DNA repair protein RecO (recombination protein O)